jgi:hypothetical protein
VSIFSVIQNFISSGNPEYRALSLLVVLGISYTSGNPESIA